MKTCPKPLFTAGFICLALSLSCGSPGSTESDAAEARPSSISDGAWLGSAGSDGFYFELDGSEEEGFTGVVHCMRDSRKVSELPITDVFLQGDSVRLTMAATGVVLAGSVDLSSGVIDGYLEYPDGGGMEMDLSRVDPESVPGLRARPSDMVPYVYGSPGDRGDGWTVGNANETGLDPERIEVLIENILQGDAGVVHSLLIVRDGMLVVEEYFHGYGPDDLHGIASVTKSVTSLLVGMAVADGTIPGVDVPLSRFFPEDSDLFEGPMGGETLRHLLTMTMGLDWTPEEAWATHGTGPAFFREVLIREVVTEPGTEWDYVSAQADLLAGVLKHATGVHGDRYASQRLFGPLGITDWDWETGRTDGYPQMDGTLMLRPRDMARIGWMVLEGGAWNGTQVVPADWIAASTSPIVETGEPVIGGYGFLWWTGSLPVDSGSTELILANGWGSQFIAVLPELNTVIVTTGGNQDNGKHLAVAGLLGDLLRAP